LSTTTQYFLFAEARVHLEQGDALQVAWQLAKQSVLFLPAQWIGLALHALLHLNQRRRIEPGHAIVVTPNSGREA
jgi:hypothetical protein